MPQETLRTFSSISVIDVTFVIIIRLISNLSSVISKECNGVVERAFQSDERLRFPVSNKRSDYM